MTRKTDPILDDLPALRRYALTLSRDEGEAEDLVQEALLRGHEARGTLRAGGNIRGWLFGILHNVFVDRYRSRTAEARRIVATSLAAPQSAEAPQEAVVRLSQIRAAFLDLPQDQREALHLVAIEGLSYAEAADIAGVPIGTIMSRISRACARLREFEEGPARPALQVVGGRNARG
ncbi:sigma-70 family RNA polymerase sigma factor [Haematobacter missouriensis]|uniref:sigma-70 family RNA polymerase sigma factor n=1 Tax=Haematobacter missouriensis TaxID=366616 RepID=UPI0023F46D34|nr:sigma-70 family RNA polymerase sigma factor [Haematobacter missouriensis]